MALHPSMLQVEPTLTLYAGQEEQSPDTWATQYIDVWLLLEVTAEDEAGEPVRGKLCAINKAACDLDHPPSRGGLMSWVITTWRH